MGYGPIQIRKSFPSLTLYLKSHNRQPLRPCAVGAQVRSSEEKDIAQILIFENRLF
jgi:hypothetical protein